MDQSKKKRVHFISIGGSIMHNLAINMHKKGYIVTGSDDEIFEPAKTRLLNHDLLPSKIGWNPELIDSGIDKIVLGMHAKKDNPELLKAQELNLNIQSFPELVYENAKDQMRICIAGSHGKTTITSMVMHVLSKIELDFDYMVGAKLKGFEDSVKISESAKHIVLEADEYLSSAIDMRPKFLWYQPHIALISGIAWDHINVFPTFENYKEQFVRFIETFPEGAKLIYYGGDPVLREVVDQFQDIHKIPYNFPLYRKENGQYIIEFLERDVEVQVSGKHNLLNIEGARLVCAQMGISPEVFYTAIHDFEGAGKRLQILKKTDNFIAYKDFAHSPSKVKATVEGVRDQYDDFKICSFLELHTYSSLNKDFLPLYKDSLSKSDVKAVYINPEAIKLKRLENLDADDIKQGFNEPNLNVFFEIDPFKDFVKMQTQDKSIFLFMSSGNYDGWELEKEFET